MENHSSAFKIRPIPERPAIPRRRRTSAPRLPAGLALGGLGTLAFSFSFPATKLAVAGIDPWLVAAGRCAVAGLLACAVLAARRSARPRPRQLVRLVVVAGAVVIGFPLLSTLALRSTAAAHGAVVIAVLPAATALVAVLSGRERPRPSFWVATLAGVAVVVAFTVIGAGGAITAGDLLLLLATAVCATGYAEGGALARELGGSATICWALVIALPLTVPGAALALVLAPPLHASASAFGGLVYVAAISQLLGFFAWYAGLARGGVAHVGQIQLLQPLLTVAWSALLLSEHVGPGTALAAVAVIACVFAVQRTRDPRPADAAASDG